MTLPSQASVPSAPSRPRVDEVKSSGVDVEAPRIELAGMNVDAMAASQELLARVFDLPDDVALRPAGPPSQNSYRWGGTGRLEARMRELGGRVDNRRPERPAHITARFAAREPMTFVERPAPPVRKRSISTLPIRRWRRAAIPHSRSEARHNVSPRPHRLSRRSLNLLDGVSQAIGGRPAGDGGPRRPGTSSTWTEAAPSPRTSRASVP